MLIMQSIEVYTTLMGTAKIQDGFASFLADELDNHQSSYETFKIAKQISLNLPRRRGHSVLPRAGPVAAAGARAAVQQGQRSRPERQGKIWTDT